MVNRIWLTRFLVVPFFVGSILLTSGCGTGPAVYADPGSEIEVRAGKEFVIDLESNPTTGYTWQETHDSTAIKLIEKNYEQSETETPVMGAGGVETFRFQALKSGATKIEFVYQRAWEAEPINEKTFSVTVE